MGAIIMDGNKLAKKIKNEIKEEIKRLDYKPCLAIIQVGHEPASDRYVKWKLRDCEECGISTQHLQLEPSRLLETILKMRIAALNGDHDVHGIIVQLPLPADIDANRIMDEIAPWKDVDGLSATNVGKLSKGDYANALVPCTPLGVMRLIHEYYSINLEGCKACIVGRSSLVGKPLAQLLLAENATVTMCHSKTDDLYEAVENSHILISAVGKPGIFTKKMLTTCECIVDVGTTVGEDGKLHGDIGEYDEVIKLPVFITPVPGGVGPMTRAMLLENTLKAYKLQNGIMG
jgi:methylenetetrahydrofolate dehydrogenase (NADP+)/methenyltetrahydrofolate cyclohydrolase